MRGVCAADRRCCEFRLWHIHHSLGGLRREFQSVHEAAFGQLDFEAILALRLCVAQSGFRRFPENGFVGGLFG